MPERHRVADAAALAEDGDRAFAEVGGVEVAVFRIDGELHAAANHCVHQGGPVCEGELRGRYEVDDDWEWVFDPVERNVVCPWHGWKFDLTTGENLNEERYAIPTYEVTEEDGAVYVER